MTIEALGESVTFEDAGEVDLIGDAELVGEGAEGLLFGSEADNGELGANAEGAQTAEGGDEEVDAFIRDEAADVNKVFVAGNVRSEAEAGVVVGIGDDLVG